MKQWIRIEVGLSILFVLGAFFFSFDLGADTPKTTHTKTAIVKAKAPTEAKTKAVAKVAKTKLKKAEAATTQAAKSIKQPTKIAAAKTVKKKKKKKGFLEKILPILLLLIVVIFILGRLPSPSFDGVSTTWRDKKFLRRRVMNWLPLGMTYAFLYMGRYNLKVSKFAFESMAGPGGESMMSNQDFGVIFGVGTVVYGMSFLFNGPLTDRLGGRFAILVGSIGSAVMNLLMGLASWSLLTQGPMSAEISQHFVAVFSVLYAINMYFQSFGAVAIVKVNASWFHVRERGVFGAIFGILISLGIYLAFDIGYMILKNVGLTWVFFTPAIFLVIFWVVDFMVVRDTPGDAGLEDFDTADASSGDDGPQLGAVVVFKLMLKNPIIMTIALIEFCSGFLRQAIMQWFRTFAKQTDAILHLKDSFVYDNWGMLLCIAGITGGVFAGIISDRVFQSRRGPVAGLLYGVMSVGAILMALTYQAAGIVGALVIVMSMAVIGVHGMLSGTASMDFGGKKNVGVAVGLIDGFVYLGTGVMSFTYAFILPKEQIVNGVIVGASTDPANWIGWPVAMIPIAIIGFVLSLRVWNAKPKPKSIT